MENMPRHPNEEIKSFLSRLTAYAVSSRYRWIVAVAVIIVILLFSLLSTGGTKKENAWIPVQKGTFVIDFTESGEIRAVNSYQVQAPMVYGMELQITDMINEGTYVQKGDYLAQFDTSTLTAQLDTAIDQLKAQEAEVLSVKTRQESQMSDLESNLKMAEYSRDAAQLQLALLKFESEVRKEDSNLSYEKALINYDLTITRINTQKIINEAETRRVMRILKFRQDSVENLEQRIAQLTLNAPVSGMVVYNEVGGFRGTARHKIAIGETVFPNMTIIIIPVLTEMESVIRVNEIDASKVKVGQKVLLSLDAFNDRVFQGHVYSIAPLADKAESVEETQIKDYEVIVRIEVSDQILKPGMSARTRIVIEEIPDALYVPIGAVLERNGEPVIFTQKSYPAPVIVTPGKRSNQYIMITGDVKEGDKIALTPPITDIYPLGWFAEMERRASEKEELLGHLDIMDKSDIANIIITQMKNRPKEIPEQFQRLANILEKASQPLTNEQIEKLSSIPPEADSRESLNEVLTEAQRTIMSSSRGGSSGRQGQPGEGGQFGGGRGGQFGGGGGQFGGGGGGRR